MTLVEFEQEIFTVALSSSVCDIPVVRRLTPSAINLRINTTSGDFIDAFYNEQTGTMAFALIRAGRRIFGADNTGSWHYHPFAHPDQHIVLPNPMSFAEFVAEIERQ